MFFKHVYFDTVPQRDRFVDAVCFGRQTLANSLWLNQQTNKMFKIEHDRMCTKKAFINEDGSAF